MLFRRCKLTAVQTTAFHPPENEYDAKYTESTLTIPLTSVLEELKDPCSSSNA